MKKSKLGYKRYSPDVNKSYNIIPSGRITMRDVDFPVYGIDDMGNAQIMYPGEEYRFPGKQVFEIPMAQIGLNLPKPYIRSDFFTPRQIEEARYNQARKFATPASGRIEGEGLIDVVLPVVAAPIAKAIAKPLMTIVGDAASYATTQTPLRNAWRLNPKAYQYNLPENTMWRGIGREGMDDAVSSGVFRSKQDVPVEYFPGSTLRTSKSFGTNPYFTPKFKTAADYGDNFIAEVPIGAANWRNRYPNKPWSQIADKQIPIDEGRILQKDWLRGYKPLDISKQTGGEQLQTPQPVIRPNFFTSEQIRQARIDAAKKAPLTFEGRINEALGNPKERAADLSQKVAPKGEGPVDNIRHTVAGMYTADAIANQLSPYAIGPTAVVPKIAGFMGSNLAGLAHEVKAFIPSLEGNYRNIPATARMSAEDMINNFVGSALSLNPFMNEKEKEDLIVKMSYENYLPDGYAQIHPKHSKDLYFKKEYGGDLEEFGSGGLKQWFAEKWVDVKTGKECGRSGKDKDGRPYPACRPSKRINSTTPKTTSEMSSSEKAKFKSVKTSGQRISYNHKRRQRGGQMSGSLGYDSMYGSPIAAFRYMMNPKDESKYYGEVYGTKQGPGIAAGLDYDNQKYGTQGMIRLGADPLRGASIRAQGGKRFNTIDNRTEDLSWGPYGGVNFQTNDYTEFTGTGNQLDYNNLRPRLTAGVNAQYDRELANRGRFSVEGDLGIGVGNRYGNMGEFQPEPYGAIKATYSPPMYKNTRGKNNTKNKRPSPTTYSPRGYQLGGPTSAFIPLMVAAQAKLSSLFGSDESTSKSASKSVDWTQMKRPDQIKYGIDQIVALEPEDRRKSLENLLEATAYMENRYGADPRAYGRSYTSSFMSIDPIALKDMFTGRGDKGNYNAAQRAQMENFKRLNLPTDQKQFDSRLRKDDPVAAMAAARYRYAMSPQALPDPNNPQQMFDYWLTNYNGKGVLKHQTRDQAYKEFLKGYKMAVGND